MPLQHERERCARNQRNAETLRIITDQIRIARDFVDVACDATRATNAAVATLLGAISDKLTEATDALYATDQEGSPDAA